MPSNLDKYDQNLKTILDSYEPAYSNKAWERLGNELPKSNMRWYYAVASVVLLVITPILLFQLTNDNVDIENPIANIEDSIIESDELINSEAVKVEADIKVAEKPLLSSSQKIINEPIQEVKLEEDIITPTVQLQEEGPQNGNIEIKEVFVPNEKLNRLQPEIVLNLNEACAPFIAKFDIKNLPQGASVSWKISEVFTSELESFEYKLLEAGIYPVLLNISTDSETYALHDELTILESPKADFRFTEEEGQIFVENTSEKFDNLLWIFPGVETDEQNPVFEVLYSGTYNLTLKVFNSQGCESSIKKNIVYEVSHDIFVPDAFTPDGDGVNDEFKVKYKIRLGYVYTFEVYNSQGRKLFETQDPEKGWAGEQLGNDSKFNNEKYIWRLIIKEPNGLTSVEEGCFVQL